MNEHEMGIQNEVQRLDNINKRKDNSLLALLLVEENLMVRPDYYSRLAIAINDDDFWQNYLPMKNLSEMPQIISNIEKHKNYLYACMNNLDNPLKNFFETEIKRLQFFINRIKIENQKL